MKAYIVKLEINHIGIWPPEASAIPKNQIKWKPDIFFIFFLKKLHICFFLKAYVVKLERNYIGIWGSGVKITKASYQIIKWYVPKKKLHI